ncbi:hypothetical protein D9757_012274 [Collybiopsis confluens]|uniref:Glucose-6-phosphate 1-dehydrogenase n=1 Tax=Collybiopsis confluens TaxID=2823264 RepID=A0A8H5GPV8_9AGAR|nr:hypothetical protein D9757_012274 [Collybiopsis confluens]
MPESQITKNTIFVVAGASGDLAKKLVYPAFFSLFHRGYLPQPTYIVGYARSIIDHETFLNQVTENIPKPADDPTFPAKLERFKAILSYQAGSYDDPAKFQELNIYLESLESNYSGSERNRIFYLALPSTAFVQVAENLKKNVYTSHGTNRLIVEKPIGSDLESALELVHAISQYWTEDETFRIDHYLGKEIIKAIPVLRFANSVTSGFWDSKLISNVQITLNESFGTEGRGGYYDTAGVIRDVIQNHLCQVFSLLAMERPSQLNPTEIINEKVKLLQATQPVNPENVLLGQYIGYLDDPGVPKDSLTATYAANVLLINNDRWYGVPFILRSGKALNETLVEVRIQYKDAPGSLFGNNPRSELIMRIQPNEAISIKLNIKSPGFDSGVVPAELKLNYKAAFPDVFIPGAYEVLIRDVLNGDHATFVRNDELEAAWKIFTPILHYIDGKTNDPRPVPTKYEFGSQGPPELAEFLAAFDATRV